MPTDNLLTFLTASALLAIAPGPDNLFVLMQSALYGAKRGVMVTLGLCTGLVFHTAAVALGVAVLIQSSALALTGLKLLGALYLLYLAVHTWRASAQSSSETPALSLAVLYRRGVIMNLTNPKVGIFFLAFLPQFVTPEHGDITGQIVQLGAWFSAVALVIFSGIALLSGALSLWLRSVKAQIALNRVAALVFVALALNLLLAQL